MVAGKCTPTPVSPSESKTIRLTKTPIRLGSIQSPKVTIGTIVPEKIKTHVVAVKPKTESDVLEVSSEATPMKSQIAAIREKLVIGAIGSSASSTTSAGKAITTPTISLARPEERSTPNTANPNKLIPVTEKRPITLAGGISASSISSTPTTFQKAVSTPTIAIQKPETVVLGGISISPASGVTTSIKRPVAVHKKQPVTRTPVAITKRNR
jgi:hypothetical protein